MIASEKTYLSGNIYKNRFSKDPDLVLNGLREFAVEGVTATKWKRACFVSTEALLGEDETIKSYKYLIYFKESKSKGIIIVLSQNKNISSYINKVIFNNSFEFSTVGIDTNKILEKISKDKARYLITSIHSRVAGMRQTVTALSLYGMDVIRSPLFEQYHENIETMACGIGRLDNSFNGYSELVRFSNEGTVSFHLRDESFFETIDTILNYIYDCLKYL